MTTLTDHDPKPYPTIYAGRQYRSRLEARWAAFFTNCGWPFEYEPYDLGASSPDFVLRGHRWPILAEVKPITDKDEDVCRKMADAANATGFTGELLLLGVSPFVIDENDPYTSCGWLGWLNDLSGEQYNEGFLPCIAVRAPDGRPDFAHCNGSWAGRMTGAYDGDRYVDGSVATDAKRFWNAACNAVQWSAQ